MTNGANLNANKNHYQQLDNIMKCWGIYLQQLGRVEDF